MTRHLIFALAAIAAASPTVAAPSLVNSPTSSFRHITATGTTKPGGATLDVRRGTTMSLDRKSQELGRYIATAICTGC